MSAQLFSPAWHRVQNLRPRLRAHTEVHRHRYRGELWYLLQDHVTGRFHRLTPATYAVVGLMDGRLTLDQIWERACARAGDDMPSQGEVIRLLAQLHRADVVQAEIPPDIAELGRRRDSLRRQKLLTRLKSPLSIRIPLWDPDRFLERTAAIARLAFSPAGAAAWLLLVGLGAALAVLHFDALSENLADRVLALENLVVLWLVYPVVKAVHELGHGYAVKRWQGEVHEIGIMLLVFVPVPYVEASAAYAFPHRYQRMLVDGAGILVELAIASAAMIVWALVEPGALRSVAFNVMLVAGVSTVLFNGNPLLRFDAYYVLADWLGMPNLGPRANRQTGIALKRLLLGIESDDPPARSAREAAWLIGYAVVSFCYRVFIMLSIALFVAARFFFVGALLALWTLYGFLVQPLIKLGAQLMNDPAIQARRGRLTAVAAGLATVVAVCLFALPVTHTTLVNGVLWVPEDARVVTGASGEITRVLAVPGTAVARGEPLVEMRNASLAAQVRIAAADVAALAARQAVARSERDGVASRLLAEELVHAEQALAELEAEQAELVVSSPAAGTFHLLGAEHLPGRFVARGEPLGYVLPAGERRGRVLVRQSQIGLVRSDVRSLSVRFAEALGEAVDARLVREVPGAGRELPSPVFSVEGGGTFALAPDAVDAPLAYEPFFQFEIALDGAPAARVGERLYVRFEHTPEALGLRWLRAARRVLLERLDV